MFTKSDKISQMMLELEFNKNLYFGAQQKLKELREKGYWENSDEILQVFEDIKNLKEEELLIKEALTFISK